MAYLDIEVAFLVYELPVRPAQTEEPLLAGSRLLV